MEPRTVVWITPEEIPDAPLRAACMVALGAPDYFPWMADEIEGVRMTISAYLNACVAESNPETPTASGETEG